MSFGINQKGLVFVGSDKKISNISLVGGVSHNKGVCFCLPTNNKIISDFKMLMLAVLNERMISVSAGASLV